MKSQQSTRKSPPKNSKQPARQIALAGRKPSQNAAAVSTAKALSPGEALLAQIKATWILCNDIDLWAERPATRRALREESQALRFSLKAVIRGTIHRPPARPVMPEDITRDPLPGPDQITRTRITADKITAIRPDYFTIHPVGGVARRVYPQGDPRRTDAR